MSIYRNLAYAGVSVLALATPAFAAAPVAVETASSDSVDIVVEARRKSEGLQDVPLTVNAVTSEAVSKLNLRDFKEITSLVPGLSMANNANGIGTTSSVRGVNFDVNASGNNGTIEYYVNDVPMSSAPLFQAIYDIAQIEVLRGPQGTLRGRASPSGSITITYKKPDLYEVGAYVNGTVNTIGGRNVNFGMGLPLIKGVLGLRLAGLYEAGEANRVRSINNGTNPDNQTRSGRVSLRFEPADWFQGAAMYQKTQADRTFFNQNASFSQFSAGAPASPLVINSGDLLSVANAPGVNTQWFDQVTWQASIAQLGQKLTYEGGHLVQHFMSFAPADAGRNFPTINTGQNTDSRGYSDSMEVRLQNEERIAGMFDYVIGYFEYSGNSPTNLGSPSILTIFGNPAGVSVTPVSRAGGSREESIYGNLTAHFGDATELSGGLRHIVYRAVGSLTVSGNVLAAAAEDSRFTNTIFNASLKHRFSPGFLAYATVGSSFRPGISATGDFSLARSALENSFIVLPPETSKSYEFGIKADLFDKKVKLNLSVYQQDFKNYPYRSASGVYYQNFTFTGGSVVPALGIFNFVAAVPVRVRGIEAELGYNVSKNFKLSGSLAYADGKINNGTIPCTDLNNDGVPDVLTTPPTLAQIQAAAGANNLSACKVTQRSANASPFSGNMQAEYTANLNPKLDGYIRGLFTFNGGSVNDPSNAFDNRGSYGLLNLYTGIRDPKGAWEVSLFAKNITNSKTVLSVGNGPDSTTFQALQPPTFRTAVAGSATSTYTDVTIVAPREFGITARFAFGSR